MSAISKLASCLSIVLALFLIYNLIGELRDGISLEDIDIIAVLFLIIIISNAILGFLLLIKKIKSSRSLLILQIFIIIPTCLLLYCIFFNSTVSCY